MAWVDDEAALALSFGTLANRLTTLLFFLSALFLSAMSIGIPMALLWAGFAPEPTQITLAGPPEAFASGDSGSRHSLTSSSSFSSLLFLPCQLSSQSQNLRVF